MSDAFICRRGGGGTGATLTVNAPAGVSVIATNTATSRAYTRTANSDGVAVFKGLPTGTYFVHITDGATTSEDFTANIIADYELTVNFFAAYINVTYPAGSTCVVKNSSGETVASDSNIGSSTKTWTATVQAADTYTVTATATSDSNKTKSQSVSITADGQSASVSLAYILYLFNGGDVSSVTGGWSDELEIKSGELVVTGGARFYTGCTKKSFSTLGYTTLTYIGKITYNNDWKASFRLGLSQSYIHGNTDLDSNFVVSGTSMSGTTNIDIANAQGDFYFAARGYMGTANISQIYLH